MFQAAKLQKMKNRNQRDLEKHWAEQSRKKTPAELLRIKAEKLQKKIEQEKPPKKTGTSEQG
jgi:hypothetical protein